MTEESTKSNGTETARVGVFVCHCGSNIAGYLDCPALTEYAAGLPGVVYAKNNLYTCSESGIAEIQKAIREQQLTRVVVASCSPRTHMPLFKSSCGEAGLNPYLFEMANIRDQCSWVHMQERDLANDKARDLIRMAVAKATFLKPEQDIVSSVTRKALVIGGGVAGLSAAEALGGMGFEVFLAERESVLGGTLRNLNRLGPAGDLASDRINHLIDQVKAQQNVKVLLSSEVVAVTGVIGSYDITLEQRKKGNGKPKSIQQTVGCIVVATGAVPFKPEGMYEYDGKKVITQSELEQQLQSGKFSAKSVVMLQCVGARSKERGYCSRICCLTAVKNAVLIREMNPDAEVRILYRDMQMYGTENERLLWESRGRGVKYDVYDADNPPVVKPGMVEYYQPLMGEIQQAPCDLVVLSTPLVAREDVGSVANLMRLPTDQNGFFLEAHAKLRPLDFATDGIFVCGAARYPATATEARAQGLGAASRAATVLFKEKLITSALVAEIDQESCVGCQGCLGICPYGAIDFMADKGVCKVNEVLCKGCGNCASTCPSQSVSLRGFTPKQILSQIRAAARA